MSLWFRGVIDAAYVGSPAKPSSKTTHPGLSPFDIRLYRATISAIERIAPPDDATGSTTTATGTATPPSTTPETQEALRQAELQDVTFVGVGSEEASDAHAAYDLRITDVCLHPSTKVEDQVFGRLTGTVVGSLAPSDPMRAKAQKERDEKKARQKATGTWVEALRGVLIVAGAWFTFGLCGATTGWLWVIPVFIALLLRLVLRRVAASSPAARVLGWTLVLVAMAFGWLVYHRVTRVECDTTVWWLVGIVMTVFVTALLRSRYPFLWTKAIWCATLLSLCTAQRASSCRKHESPPSVISQGPRTEPDGHWPKAPTPFQAEAPKGSESREFAPTVSVAQAMAMGDALWEQATPIAIYLPLSDVLDGEGNPKDSIAFNQLGQILSAQAGRTLLVEAHGRDEADGTTEQASTVAARLATLGIPSSDIRPRGLANRYPLLPTDGEPLVSNLNRRIEIRILPQSR